MKRLLHFVRTALIVVILASLLAACNNPNGGHAPTGGNTATSHPAASNSAPAANTSSPAASAQPAVSAPNGNMTMAADPQADDVELSLTDLDNQLKATDTLDDIK